MRKEKSVQGDRINPRMDIEQTAAFGLLQAFSKGFIQNDEAQARHSINRFFNTMGLQARVSAIHDDGLGFDIEGDGASRARDFIGDLKQHFPKMKTLATRAKIAEVQTLMARCQCDWDMQDAGGDDPEQYDEGFNIS